MLCRDILAKIEERYPTSLAMDWDNVGLLTGSRDREVQTVYIALDALDEVIDGAEQAGAELLITHHPLLFSPVKRITDEDFIGRRLLGLIRSNITYYAMHTNYDVAGMAELAGLRMGFAHPQVLEETCPAFGEEGAPAGIGRVDDLRESMTLGECCVLVKERFDLDTVRFFGDPDRKLTRAAISPGSGRSMVDAALKKGADVLITGDIDHHTGIDAVAQGLSIIDGGHYGIEKIFIRDMAEFLRKNFPEITVITAPPRDPFRVM